MANSLASYPKISDLSYRLITVSRSARRTKLISSEGHFGYLEIKTTSSVVHCSSSSTSGSSSSSSTTSTSSAENSKVGFVGSGKFGIDSKGEFKYLVSEYGWKVRSLFRNGDEVRKAARVQAEAFHEPVFLFNDFFFQFFQAEVLSGLVYKLRSSPPNRYACLVAEPMDIKTSKSEEIVGVVDLTASVDRAVLEHLPPDADEYLYVSGIAVLKSSRRKKVATVLLKACDTLSAEWGFQYLALRAYEDDYGARELYANAGYRVVSGDPPWMSTWIGRKRRVLMIKQSVSTR